MLVDSNPVPNVAFENEAPEVVQRRKPAGDKAHRTAVEGTS